MIKSWLITFIFLLFLTAAYYFDLFALLASRYTFFAALGLVIAVLLAAFKILGNPFSKMDDHDDEL